MSQPSGDYISRQAALKTLLGEATKHGQQLQGQGKHMTRNEGDAFRRDYEALKTVPASDVVSVVRCKDCRYYERTEQRLCERHGCRMLPLDYCGHAEPRDGGEPHD